MNNSHGVCGDCNTTDTEILIRNTVIVGLKTLKQRYVFPGAFGSHNLQYQRPQKEINRVMRIGFHIHGVEPDQIITGLIKLPMETPTTSTEHL